MHKEPQEIPRFVNASHLVSYFSLTWYKFTKFRKLAVIPAPDGFLHGRPLWLRSRFKQIGERIEERAVS